MTLGTGRETADFTFSAGHVGFEVDFHHPKGAGLALAESVIRRYEVAKEAADIFTQAASATAFTSDEILSWFLLQTGTALADHLPPAALEGVLNAGGAKGGEVLVTFPIRFPAGAFVMETVEGAVAIRSLKLLVRVAIRPKTGA